MAGIEEAFKKFVTRVSSKEEPQDEYGDPQTGEKRIPLMQGIKRGYDFENTMPNYYNQRYDYENQMPIYQNDRYNIPQQELAYGGVASMFRERPGYQIGGTINPFDPMQRPDDLGLPGEENLTEETLEQAMARGVIFYDPITGRQINRVGTREVGFDPNFISQRAMQAQQDAAARPLPINIPSVATPSNFLSPYQSMQQEILTRLQSIPTGGTTVSVSEGSSGISPLFRINRAIQAEQDAAARVTPTRMAFGGLASFNQGGQVKSYEEQTLNKKGYETTGMSKKEIFDLYDSVMGTFSRRFADGGLTKTVPPAMGPDSQGVESLFRRRYN